MRWVFTLLMVIFAIRMLYHSVYFDVIEKGDPFPTSGLIFILFPLGWAVYVFFTTAVTTTTIDKQRKILTVKKKGLLKDSFSSYSFIEIDGFPFVEATYGRRTYYSIRLPLKTGESIELAALRSLNKKTYYNAVDRANKYLFDAPDKELFKLTILDDD
jgi:hypothetical protein